MFKARFMTRAEVDEFYRQALVRYERIVMQEHLNTIAASVPEGLRDIVRAATIMDRIEADWASPYDEA